MFSPAVSPRARVVRAELNGHSVPFQISNNTQDQHINIRLPLALGTNTLRILVQNDFDLGLTPALPALGQRSEGLRVISEVWSGDRLELEVSGSPGIRYAMSVWNAGQVASVDGSKLEKVGTEVQLRFQFPETATDVYPREKIVIHFAK